ncbi:MAG: hypothetical protein AAF698_04285 [Pseudomonadota bacterium]
MTAWFRVKPEAPWGDYGNILAHGMTGPGSCLQRDRVKVVTLERSGPFVPPVTQPHWGVIVVSEAAMHVIEAAGLTGCKFVPVEVVRCVKLAWEEWDLDADEPQRYPAQGEPENYVLGRKHSPNTAAALPPLFFIDMPHGDDMVPREPRDVLSGRERLYRTDLIDPAAHPGTDFAEWRSSMVVVSQRARDILADLGGRWLRFDPLTPV